MLSIGLYSILHFKKYDLIKHSNLTFQLKKYKSKVTVPAAVVVVVSVAVAAAADSAALVVVDVVVVEFVCFHYCHCLCHLFFVFVSFFENMMPTKHLFVSRFSSCDFCSTFEPLMWTDRN